MLYHEKQVAGLCAVHALNTLMQNSIFTEIDLMQIAHEFDRREKEVMMASGIDSTDFLKSAPLLSPSFPIPLLGSIFPFLYLFFYLSGTWPRTRATWQTMATTPSR
jgi:hypothetical protein